METSSLLNSIATDSMISCTTYSSSGMSALRGTGSIGAKGLFIVGSLIIKGVDAVFISRRLAIAKSQIPHGTNVDGWKLVRVFGDLLELVLGAADYPARYRARATYLLFAQIEHFESAPLVNAIVRWPSHIVRGLVAEIMRRYGMKPPTETEDWKLLIQPAELFMLFKRIVYQHTHQLPGVTIEIISAQKDVDPMQDSGNPLLDDLILFSLKPWTQVGGALRYIHECLEHDPGHFISTIENRCRGISVEQADDFLHRLTVNLGYYMDPFNTVVLKSKARAFDVAVSIVSAAKYNQTDNVHLCRATKNSRLGPLLAFCELDSEIAESLPRSRTVVWTNPRYDSYMELFSLWSPELCREIEYSKFLDAPTFHPTSLEFQAICHMIPRLAHRNDVTRGRSALDLHVRSAYEDCEIGTRMRFLNDAEMMIALDKNNSVKGFDLRETVGALRLQMNLRHGLTRRLSAPAVGSWEKLDC